LGLLTQSCQTLSIAFQALGVEPLSDRILDASGVPGVTQFLAVSSLRIRKDLGEDKV
jgi:hypothetical protein